MPKKIKWGGKREKKLIYKYHEKWAKENGYRDNKWEKHQNGELIIMLNVQQKNAKVDTLKDLTRVVAKSVQEVRVNEKL